MVVYTITGNKLNIEEFLNNDDMKNDSSNLINKDEDSDEEINIEFLDF